MGQFLAIGLMCSATVSRKTVDNGHITVEELRNEIEQSLFYDMSFYDETITDKHIVFTIKEDVMKKWKLIFPNRFTKTVKTILSGFLKSFYNEKD
ncbi:MAG: hypothetical protein LBT50_02215 [Prevotellaceae bacterium]|jgi:hypothetical protein|nr:hypothetical protein [Prevotellaceae bacterium]